MFSESRTILQLRGILVVQTANSKTKMLSPAIAWAIGALMVVGLLGLGTGVARSRACSSCHLQEAFRAETQASPHARIGCRSCHLSPGVSGQIVFALRQPLHTFYSTPRVVNRDAAAVPDSRCRSCHNRAIAGVVEANGTRVNHKSCTVGAACTKCHSAIAHGQATRWVRSYDMDACLECHLAKGNVACDLCHKGREVTERVKATAFSVTHGPEWRTTHAMGNTATCVVCHSPNDCGRCHGAGVPHESDFVGVHVKYAAAPDADCSSCHPTRFCDGCHGTKMPHPKNFIRKHPKTAKIGSDVCQRCHESSDCTDCHVKHVHPGGAARLEPVSRGGAL